MASSPRPAFPTPMASSPRPTGSRAQPPSLLLSPGPLSPPRRAAPSSGFGSNSGGGSSSSSMTGAVVASPPTSTGSNSSKDNAGLLRVEVMAARNLHAAVLGSLLKWSQSYSNAFVVITLQRDEFATTVKDKTLNPTWKEMGQLKVPLPTEQELLQTVGFTGGVGGVGGMGGAGDASGKLGGGTGKKLAAPGGFSKTASHRDFHACHPELHVQVFHRLDQPEQTQAQQVQQQQQQQQHHHHSTTSSTTSGRRPTDKLIGEVTVSLMPCLLSSSSSHRAWYTLTSEDHPDSGQIQLAMHYDVGGLEPQKGDIVRLAGFGGMEYYSKLVNATARLEVVDTFQDQVFAQCKSIEGWVLSFEFHRNLLHVVRRPSMLRDAQSQLHGHIVRVRHSPLVTRAHGVWEAIPEGQRRQLRHMYHLALYSCGVVYDVVHKSAQTTLNEGIHAGVHSCVHGSTDAVQQVSTEFVRVFWTGSSSEDQYHQPQLSRTEEMIWHLEGGPLKGRGRIVQAFGVLENEDQKGKEVVDGSAADEDESKQEDEDGEIVVDTVDGEDEENDTGSADEQDDENTEGDDEEATTRSDTSADAEDLDSCPDQLICPITGCPMLDPVVAADGHSYEREAILHWFAGSNKSPMTGMQMPTTQVFPNFTLRKLSEEFQRSKRQIHDTARRR